MTEPPGRLSGSKFAKIVSTDAPFPDSIVILFFLAMNSQEDLVQFWSNNTLRKWTIDNKITAKLINLMMKLSKFPIKTIAPRSIDSMIKENLAVFYPIDFF